MPGSLWPLLQKRCREALASGALQPVETAQEFVEDGGVRFVIRDQAQCALLRCQGPMAVLQAVTLPGPVAQG